MCGYRQGFSTQQAFVSLIEKWKAILDKNIYAGAVLMDLSKAIDTINHYLLIAKLNAYGFTKDLLRLIKVTFLIADKEQKLTEALAVGWNYF